MSDPSRLPARELAVALGEHQLRATDVTEACLARIAARDERIHAWACVDADYARRQAAALDAGPIQGPLHGVPIGVKDIFDTADLPTEYGSAIYSGHRPVADAACVALARAAGAIVLGKTVTTEFATYSPAATVNPCNPEHTPGGSSSGSAASVADGMVPLAFGTQTAGSIIRPASYCGIIGYKPTYGTIGRAGVKLLAESLDTIGVLARNVADAALLVGALTRRADLLELPHPSNALTIGLCRTHEWDHVEPRARTALEEAGRLLAASGADVRSLDLPEAFAGLDQAHGAIFGYETLRSLAHERRAYPSKPAARPRARSRRYDHGRTLRRGAATCARVQTRARRAHGRLPRAARTERDGRSAARTRVHREPRHERRLDAAPRALRERAFRARPAGFAAGAAGRRPARPRRGHARGRSLDPRAAQPLAHLGPSRALRRRHRPIPQRPDCCASDMPSAPRARHR